MRKYFISLALVLFLALLAAPGWATIYYVDSSITDTNVGSATPDFTTYDPSNYSTSTGLASVYKTVADLNAKTFADNDQILFRKGQTWSGTTWILTRGLLTISSFGSGADPILSGADTLTSFTHVTGNIYSKAVASAVNSVYYNGTLLTYARAYASNTYSDSVNTSPGANQFDWKDGTLYINVGTDPAGGVVTVSQRTIINTNGKNSLTISGLKLEQGIVGLYLNSTSNSTVSGLTISSCDPYRTLPSATGAPGILIQSGSNNQIHDNIIHYCSIGVSISGYGSTCDSNHVYSNTIDHIGGVGIANSGAAGRPTNSLIEMNTISYTGIHNSLNPTVALDGGAIYSYCSDATGTGAGHVVRKNTIFNCGSANGQNAGIMIDNGSGPTTVYSNVIYGCNWGAIQIGGPNDNAAGGNGHSIYNNTCYHNSCSSPSDRGELTGFTVGNGGPTNTTWKNNICYGNDSKPVSIHTINTGTTFANNCYYMTGSSSHMFYNTQYYTTFAAYQTAKEPTAIGLDPAFITNGSDFRLQATSPARGAGTPWSGISLITDRIGNYFSKTKPSMGAYSWYKIGGVVSPPYVNGVKPRP